MGNGETVEAVSDFIFWGSKITADRYCSHEIKNKTKQENKNKNKKTHAYSLEGKLWPT